MVLFGHGVHWYSPRTRGLMRSKRVPVSLTVKQTGSHKILDWNHKIILLNEHITYLKFIYLESRIKLETSWCPAKLYVCNDEAPPFYTGVCDRKDKPDIQHISRKTQKTL